MAGRWLVGSDIGIPPDIHEPSSRVKHRKRQVAPEAVAVIDIKYSRPRFSAVVHATNRLNLFEVQGECVPIDVRRTGYGPCNADRVLIGLQQIADVLGSGESVIVATGRLICTERPIKNVVSLPITPCPCGQSNISHARTKAEKGADVDRHAKYRLNSIIKENTQRIS